VSVYTYFYSIVCTTTKGLKFGIYKTGELAEAIELLKDVFRGIYKLTPQECEILAVLIVTIPGVVRDFSKLADTLFPGTML